MRCDVQRGTLRAAARTAEVTEMTDVGRAVQVRGSAADAVFGVGRVGQALPGHARVVEAEPNDVRPFLSEAGDKWIVDVGHHPSGRVELGDRPTPAVRDELQLPVAVELVAKEVPQADGLGANALRDLREGALVHLEQAEVRRRVSQESRCHAGDQIGARPVVGEPDAPSQDLGDDRGGRRLSVRGRDESGPKREAAGQRREGAGIHRRENLPGERRAPAATGQARQTAGCPRGGDLEGQAHAHESTSLKRVNFTASPGGGMP